MTDQDEDLFEFLKPMALRMAASRAATWGMDKGVYDTLALLGAWEAVKAYDGREHGSNVEGFCGIVILRTITNELRRELGKKGTGRSEQLKAERAFGCYPFMSDSDWANMVLIENEAGYEDVENRDELTRILDKLPPMQRDVLESSYLKFESNQSIAKRYGVHEAVVTRFLRAALDTAKEVAT